MPVNRKWVWVAVKSVLALAILIGVCRHFAAVLDRPEIRDRPFTLRPAYLLLASLLYLLAHCCWATFWVRLLRSQGVRVGWGIGVRAYFVSQFGKYIPGKAWVILMRIGLLRPFGGRPLPVAVTATYETLTSMAAGALIGVMLLGSLGVLPQEVSGNVAFLVAVGGLPVALAVLNKLAVRQAAKSRSPDAPPLPSPPIGLLAQGLLQAALGWCLLGLSLGLTVRAVVPELPPRSGPGFTADLAAVALAYVVGFVVLVAPGGLGPREFVLQLLLAPRFSEALDPALAEAQAAIVALVLRLTWTAAEVTLALSLCAWRPTPPDSPADPAPEGGDA